MNLQRNTEIVNAIRRAVEKCKHYASFTRRVLPFIQKELPEMTVYVGIEPFFRDRNKYEINVWGKDVPYDQGVRLSWYDPNAHDPLDAGKTWYDLLSHELAIHDNSDTIERMFQESTLAQELQGMDNEVLILQQKIADVRERAATMLAALPPPTCATIRQDYWRNHRAPTSATEARFQRLFGKKETV